MVSHGQAMVQIFRCDYPECATEGEFRGEYQAEGWGKAEESGWRRISNGKDLHFCPKHHEGQ
jgi:hypothetical protein